MRLFFVIIFVFGFSAALHSQPRQYTVSAGETLSLIALNYTGRADNADRIASFNGIKKPDSIRAGQRLIIPGELYAPVRDFIAPGGHSEAEYFNTAAAAAAQGDLFKASGYFAAAYRAGGAPEALYNQALALYYMGRFGQAADLMEKASGKTPEVSVLLALCYFAEGRSGDFKQTVKGFGPETDGADPVLLKLLRELAGDAKPVPGGAR